MRCAWRCRTTKKKYDAAISAGVSRVDISRPFSFNEPPFLSSLHVAIMAESKSATEKMTVVVSEIVAQLIEANNSGEEVNLTR